MGILRTTGRLESEARASFIVLNMGRLQRLRQLETACAHWPGTCYFLIRSSMTTLATHASHQLTDACFVYGQAASMQSLNAVVVEIAKTDIPVLLVGESGTGKEVYARLIHRLSGLSEAPLKKVNCAALDAGRLLGEVKEECLAGNAS